MKLKKGLMNLGLAATLCALLAGCASYRITSDVPEELRTISVPVFENASGYPEVSAIVTQHVLREFQREGTMTLQPLEDASLKLLGTVKSGRVQPIRFDSAYASRAEEYFYVLVAEITLVERGTGKLLLDAVEVRGAATFLTYDDMLSGMQNAYPRAARELARAIVDTVLATWAPPQKISLDFSDIK